MGGTRVTFWLKSRAQFGRGHPVDDPVPRKSRPDGAADAGDGCTSHKAPSHLCVQCKERYVDDAAAARAGREPRIKCVDGMSDGRRWV